MLVGGGWASLVWLWLVGEGGKMKKRWPTMDLIFVFWVDFHLVKLKPNVCLFCNKNYGLDFLWPVVEGVGGAGGIWGESESALVVWLGGCYYTVF